MKKITILGDIHGRTCWNDIVEKEKDSDLFIFLGDYVSTHEMISEDQQCSNLEDILNFKEANPDKVILLRGNHDIQHLGYYWAECSGYFPKVESYLLTQHERFLKDTQWLYRTENIIFSHAGISTTWWNTTKCDILEDLNNVEPSELFCFTPSRLSDFHGESPTQPCVWIRPNSLANDALEGYIQVVGHTPVKRITNTKTLVEDFPEIWLCDTLPNEYLVYEDGKFIPKEHKAL